MRIFFALPKKTNQKKGALRKDTSFDLTAFISDIMALPSLLRHRFAFLAEWAAFVAASLSLVRCFALYLQLSIIKLRLPRKVFEKAKKVCLKLCQIDNVQLL